VKERETNKKRDACVNSVTLHVELHYSQMHFAIDLHNRMKDFLVN
jgi:hypothetical protein